MCPIDVQKCQLNLKNIKTDGHAKFEITHASKSGREIPVEVNIHEFELNGKKVALAVSRDITDRKKAEDKIKKSLAEKEMLLKEIHHRVKNNLQIISSLLDLQERYVKEDPTAVSVLQESQNRVLSMAMIHEMLYQSDDLNHINFSGYIKNLISKLFHSYSVNSHVIPLINVEPVFLNIETAIPMGLIINEIVSNSLKYAFPLGEQGKITIDLHPSGKGYELQISDNGVGIGEDLSSGRNQDTRTASG